VKRILIVGGGYAGLYTAVGLEKLLRAGEAEVTIVEPHGYMTYQPFLPELAAGSIEPRFVAVSLRLHLRKTRVVRGSVVRVDHASRSARIRPIEGPDWDFRYDIIAVTAGAITRTFPVDGLMENAIGLKNVEEAVAVHDRLIESFERAASLPAGEMRQRLLTVTVVGGGFSGVELFGELLSLATHLLRYYPEISLAELRFHLVEAAERILPEVTDKPGRWVVKHLRDRGGLIHLSTQVESLLDSRVRLSSGEEFDSGTVIWTAGNSAGVLVRRNTDLTTNEQGYLLVRADLRAGTAKDPTADAWAAGDDAWVPDLAVTTGGRTVPNAQHAVRQGKRLARNIAATLRGENPVEYRHASLGVVATLGVGHGIFQWKGVVIKGLPAWLMHRGYHVFAIPTVERKTRVLAEWIVAFFTGRDIVALPDVRHPRKAFTSRGEPAGS